MITKIDNPEKAESKDYTNRGGVERLQNYLVGNEEKIDKDDLYFDFDRVNISSSEAIARINENRKGCKQEDHKFFSISVNPSNEELEFIGNDKEKFREFVRHTMVNYSLSFKNDKVQKEDLVWVGIIHEKRFYSEKEVGVYTSKNGTPPSFKVGDPKPGNTMHAHIIVSSRDKLMKKNIHALTARNNISRQFELKEFQRKNQQSFQYIFNYRSNVDMYHETQKRIVDKQFIQLEKMGFTSGTLRELKQVGEEMKFNKTFSYNMNSFIRDSSNNFPIKDIPEYIRKGSKSYRSEHPEVFQDGNFQKLEEKPTFANSEFEKLLDTIESASVEIGQGKQEREERRRKKRRKFGL
ncbi:MAG: hypothetical protein J0M08_06860 [Bacteroidetes bacterium]|nr:hypothetical protein [Bacteroidota bacterium]